VRVEERLGPATDLLQHPHGQRVPTAEERCHQPAPHRIRRAQARDVTALGAASLVGDAETDDAQLLVRRVQLGEITTKAKK
jgi:hypothetical protein